MPGLFGKCNVQSFPNVIHIAFKLHYVFVTFPDFVSLLADNKTHYWSDIVEHIHRGIASLGKNRRSFTTVIRSSVSSTVFHASMYF